MPMPFRIFRRFAPLARSRAKARHGIYRRPEREKEREREREREMAGLFFRPLPFAVKCIHCRRSERFAIGATSSDKQSRIWVAAVRCYRLSFVVVETLTKRQESGRDNAPARNLGYLGIREIPRYPPHADFRMRIESKGSKRERVYCRSLPRETSLRLYVAIPLPLALVVQLLSKLSFWNLLALWQEFCADNNFTSTSPSALLRTSSSGIFV